MDRNYKKWVFISLTLIAIAVVGMFVFFRNPQTPAQIYPAKPDSPAITINGHRFGVDIADTPEKRTLGLSHRQSMPADKGMLFVFDSPDRYQFWMSGMLFPLDFVWINGDSIVDITQNVPAPINGASIRIINPKSEIDKVLEINSGQVKSAGIEIGQKVQIIKS